MTPSFLLFALLLSCDQGGAHVVSGADSGGTEPSGEDTGTGSEAPTQSLPSAHTWQAPDEELDPLDLEGTQAAAQEAVEVLLHLDPLELTAGYFAVRDSLADESCPGVVDRDPHTFWEADCTTSAGATFKGYAYSRLELEEELAGVLHYDLGEVAGYGTMTSPEGSVFDFWVGTSHSTREAESGESVSAQSYLFGQVAWMAPEAEETWLDEGWKVDLKLNSEHSLLSGRRQLSVDGSVSGFTGASTTVLFEDLEIIGDDAEHCALEPAGSLAIRDPNGLWVRVVFDGDLSPEDADFVSACDGCGRATQEGVELGEVCVDFSAWTTWERRPWG